jgi:hypothetical protein
MRRLGGAVPTIAGELASLLVAGLVLLLLAIHEAPIGLGPFRAPLLDLVRTSVAPLRVAVADVAVRRSPTTGRLELEVLDLEVRDAADAPLLVARHAALAPELGRSLREERLAVDRLTVLEPEIRLRRAAGGGLVPAGDGSAPIALLRRLLGAEDGADLPVELQDLAIEGARIELVDEVRGRTHRLRDGVAVLERGRRRAFATLVLEQPGAAAQLAFLLAPAATPGRIAWAAELAGLSLAALDPMLPETVLDHVQAAGTGIAEPAGLELERLRVEALGASLQATGRIEANTGAFQLAGRVSRLDRSRLLALWPEGVAIEAREWLQAHLRSGTLEAELRARRPAAAGRLAWSLTGTAEGVVLQGLVPGRDLEAVRLALEIDERAVVASGALRIDGQPLELESLRHEFAARAGPQSVGRLRGRLAAERLAEAVPVLAGRLSGSVEGELAFELGREGSLAIRLDGDLQSLGVGLPDLSITKAVGQPGKLALAAEKRGQQVRVATLALGWPGLILDGRATLAWPELRPTTLELDRLRIAGSELGVSLALDRGELTGRIRGALLVLDPWLGGGQGGGDLPALALDLALDRVEAGGLVLLGLGGRVEHDRERWRRIELSAGHVGGGAFRIGLEPIDGRPRLVVRSDRAGLLLEAADPAADFADGGRLLLEGELGQGPQGLAFDGRLEVREVVIRRAPILARILTLASLGGILDVLTGRGLRLDRIDAGLSLAGGVLAVANARASGSELGFTAAGTIDLAGGLLDLSGTLVPVYTLNRFVGRLPLVGRLLRGQDGVGAFAVTWSARGPAAAPAIRVNPLTLVVPGFLRDLAALLAQRAEPTEAAPRD